MVAPVLSAFCILSKLTGIFACLFVCLFVCLVWGDCFCAFHHNTMGRKRPLEEKYELMAHKRSMSC